MNVTHNNEPTHLVCLNINHSFFGELHFGQTRLGPKKRQPQHDMGQKK